MHCVLVGSSLMTMLPWAIILQRSGFDKGALDAFRKALEISPQQEEIRRLVDKLTLSVEGQGI